jgi:putative transcriptional regulator
MTKNHKYRSEIAAAVHEEMQGALMSGVVSKTTMRAFEELCIEPAGEWRPDDIRALREREHVSQPIFANYLNVPKNLVSDWERGVKKPSGAAMRLLTVVQKHGLNLIA